MGPVCSQHSIYPILVVPCNRLRSFSQYRSWKAQSHIFLSSHSCFYASQRPKGLHHQRRYSIASNVAPPYEDAYIPEIDLEDFEGYAVGGHHPTIIGDDFGDGRCKVVHKLGLVVTQQFGFSC